MASTDEKTALLSTAEAAHKAQTRRAAAAVLCALALVGSAAAVVKSRVAIPKAGSRRHRGHDADDPRLVNYTQAQSQKQTPGDRFYFFFLF